MGKMTKIQWTDATFNMWSGCVEYSPGCAHCYAKTLALRNPAVLGKWGKDGTRVARVESYCRQPYAWDKEAAESGKPFYVFAHSDSDWNEQWDGPILDHRGNRLYSYVDVNASAVDGSVGLKMDDLRLGLFKIIMETQNLTWILLTKRIEHVMTTLERLANMPRIGLGLANWLASWINGMPPRNVWMLTSVEDQATAEERLGHLIKTPAIVRGVSYEPALGPVDFSRWLGGYWCNRCKAHSASPAGPRHCPNCGHEGDWDDNCDPCPECKADVEAELICPRCGADGGNQGLDTNECWEKPVGLDWIIVGGESGPGARPFDLGWAYDTVGQCREAGVACYVKQLGASPVASAVPGRPARYPLKNKKGGDSSEWPEPLRVREFPR